MTNLFAISTGAIIGIAVAAGIVLLIVIFIGAYISMRNGLIRLKNNVEEGWSTIDVYLKKRYDLIPNLVETVKGYAKHESGTLESVIAARSKAMGASGDDRIDAENQLSASVKKVFLLAEQYPELKADKQFLNLQDQLQRIESELAQSRKYYNATVKQYNNKIEMFPSNIVAKMMKLEKRKFFEVAEEERQNVKVSF